MFAELIHFMPLYMPWFKNQTSKKEWWYWVEMILLDSFEASADRRDDSYWHPQFELHTYQAKLISYHLPRQFTTMWQTKQMNYHSRYHLKGDTVSTLFIHTFAKAGDIVYVLDMSETDWWKARIKGKEGQVQKKRIWLGEGANRRKRGPCAKKRIRLWEIGKKGNEEHVQKKSDRPYQYSSKTSLQRSLMR